MALTSVERAAVELISKRYRRGTEPMVIDLKQMPGSRYRFRVLRTKIKGILRRDPHQGWLWYV